MSTDILVPHFGVGYLTQLCLRCLQSIRAHSRDYRLIFIDNGSPEFGAILPELEQHPHLLIRNSVNLGYVKAINQGLAISTAPYVVLMNNDTEAVSGWLETLQGGFVEGLGKVSVGLVGPLTTASGSWQGRWKRTPQDYHLLALGRMLAFFCVMIRRAVLDTPGLEMLDESYGVGLGDDDAFSRRAEAAGFSLMLAQNLTIPHAHRSTFKALYTNDEIAAMQKKAMEQFKATAPGGDALPLSAILNPPFAR